MSIKFCCISEKLVQSALRFTPFSKTCQAKGRHGHGDSSKCRKRLPSGHSWHQVFSCLGYLQQMDCPNPIKQHQDEDLQRRWVTVLHGAFQPKQHTSMHHLSHALSPDCSDSIEFCPGSIIVQLCLPHIGFWIKSHHSIFDILELVFMNELLLR